MAPNPVDHGLGKVKISAVAGDIFFDFVDLDDNLVASGNMDYKAAQSFLFDLAAQIGRAEAFTTLSKVSDEAIVAEMKRRAGNAS